MKFSIIIPVYNVEKYIRKCLESVQKQSYDHFEVLIINDGTKDQSQDIIDEFVKKDDRFCSFIKKNGGLSDARNYGIPYVTGDYILFIDSDDYIDQDLLLHLSDEIHRYPNVDIVKYQCRLVDEQGTILSEEQETSLEYCNTADHAEEIFRVHYFEPAWLYAYRTDFWRTYQFSYPKGRIHEDLGLTPYLVLKSKTYIRMNEVAYNYVQREGSIINSTDKNKVKVYDTMYHFDALVEKAKQDHEISTYNKSLLYSFMANALLYRCKLLMDDSLEYQKLVKELKQRKIASYLLANTWKRKYKKMVFQLSISLGLRLF